MSRRALAGCTCAAGDADEEVACLRWARVRTCTLLAARLGSTVASARASRFECGAALPSRSSACRFVFLFLRFFLLPTFLLSVGAAVHTSGRGMSSILSNQTAVFAKSVLKAIKGPFPDLGKRYLTLLTAFDARTFRTNIYVQYSTEAKHCV